MLARPMQKYIILLAKDRTTLKSEAGHDKKNITKVNEPQGEG